MQVDTAQLRKLRLKAGMRLRALALAAGVSHDTVMEIEGGRRSPHPGTVKKIAKALDVEIADLVDWEAEEDPKGKAAPVAA